MTSNHGRQAQEMPVQRSAIRPAMQTLVCRLGTHASPLFCRRIRTGEASSKGSASVSLPHEP